jgi:hypothetical protein
LRASTKLSSELTVTLKGSIPLSPKKPEIM